MIRTRAGYAGGHTAVPTYHDLADHAETVQVDYDPSRITYAQLLDEFWSAHSPVRRAYSRQYMSAVFYADEAQRRLAEESRARVTAALGRAVYTELAPLGVFYRAEDYHQKYYLRHHKDLMREFEGYSTRAFTDSRVACRLNALASGDADETMAREVASFGLSPAAEKRVLELLRHGGSGASCGRL